MDADRIATIRPETQDYYDRISVADAIEIAWEKIEEWDYDADPHGYCHERAVLVKLCDALVAANQRIAELEKGDA